MNQPWPDGALESCERCPVCAGEPRELMHSRLTDRIFFVAPGEWTMWRCLKCRSGYLDPRPTEESIHLAYSNYYTHSEESEVSANSVFGRLRLALGNDYRNSRYGAKEPFAIPLIGRIAAKLLPGARTHIDCEYRFSSAPASGRRLLDVGSGNGAFLRKARSSGWDACGVEPDAAARCVADGQGFDVRASLEEWAEAAGSFQHATASHVIEHVHDPGRLLLEIRSLLRPDGTLFIQTPNVDAPSHLRFGANWRGLEPPRHLALFSRTGLEQLLFAKGFRIAKWVSDQTVSGFLIEQSNRIREGRDPYTGLPVASPPPTSEGIPEAVEPPLQDEFLTVVAEAA